MTLAIIGGTSLLFSSLPDLSARRMATPYGPVEILTGDIILLMRHQEGRPPHRINFRANMAALAISGADEVIAFGSAGSLKPKITPGSLVIPTDYVSTTDIPSVHDHAITHVCPEVAGALAQDLAKVTPEAGFGGVYVQTRGPRIETVAEVSALAKVADLVGMTLASEATLACELGIAFAALCTVDNYAHGLGGEVLTYEHILESSRTHRHRTEECLQRIIGTFG